MGPLFWASAVRARGGVLRAGAQLWRDPTEARAMRLFHWSITYVTLLFGAMAVDQLIFH